MIQTKIPDQYKPFCYDAKLRIIDCKHRNTHECPKRCSLFKIVKMEEIKENGENWEFAQA